MFQTDFTLELFGIKDQNITVLNVTNEHVNRESICRITSKLTYPVERCANCGYKKVVKNRFRKAHVRLASFNGIRYELDLWKQRFYRTHCYTTFGAETDIVEFNHTLSRTLKNQVMMLFAMAIPKHRSQKFDRGTSGPLEGINRKIKSLKRSCYGFSNIEYFFKRIDCLFA